MQLSCQKASIIFTMLVFSLMMGADTRRAFFALAKMPEGRDMKKRFLESALFQRHFVLTRSTDDDIGIGHALIYL